MPYRAALTKLYNTTFGVVAMFDICRAWEALKKKRNAAAIEMQKIARGKHARAKVKEMKETGKKMEIKELEKAAEVVLEPELDVHSMLEKQVEVTILPPPTPSRAAFDLPRKRC